MPGLVVAVLAAFHLFGLVIGAVGLQQVARAIRSRRWPTTWGIITRLALDRDDAPDCPTYRVEVRYTYEVDGIAHEGDRVTLVDWSSSNKATHEAIRRQLAGRPTIAVAYDPARPADSCLQPGMTGGVWLIVGACLAWEAVALAVTLVLAFATPSERS